MNDQCSSILHKSNKKELPGLVRYVVQQMQKTRALFETSY